MGPAPRPTRRRLLAGLCGVATSTALAGCANDSSGDRPGGGDATEEARDETATPSADDELDLREANVVGVSVERTNGSDEFDVTLHHDDEGESGYANWWQIERLDGTRLGRRELLHAHAQQPFTRSETVEIPADVTCVVVRGHDQTHGYGGVARVVDLESGATRPIDQGSERRSFGPEDCP